MVLRLGFLAVACLAETVRWIVERWSSAWPVDLHVADTTRIRPASGCATRSADGQLVRAHQGHSSCIDGALMKFPYYAGLMTLRYDFLEPNLLDRAVGWMTGWHQCYAFSPSGRRSSARAGFGQRTAAAFDRPVLVYEPAGTALFDLSAPPEAGSRPIVVTRAFPDVAGCDPPVPLAPLVLR